MVEPQVGSQRAKAQHQVIAVGTEQDDLALLIVVDGEQWGQARSARPCDGADVQREALCRGESLAHQPGIRDRAGRDPQPGKGRVEYPAAVQLQMREAGSPLPVVARSGEGWREQHACGPAHGGGGEGGRAGEARGARRGRQQPECGRPRDQRAERAAERVGKHVAETRVAPGDVELRQLDGGGQERGAERAACDARELEREGRAQRSEQEDVEQHVARGVVAARDAADESLGLVPGKWPQGGDQDGQQRSGEEAGAGGGQRHRGVR